ncbi:hypothetical protein AB0J21_25765 [Streptomyces sp. NPDC049954]|uniref:hypothetical protein n=1 Tax=Streptomyces sp. NPDC049954 TaxID=3155779 RepID=UPI00342856DD
MSTLTPARPEAAAPAAPRAGALRAQLRHGLGRWAGALLAATLLTFLASNADSWQGLWSETQFKLHGATVLLGGPVALGAGCWSGGFDRRRGTTELLRSAARSPLWRFLMTALPLAAWAVAGYAVATAAVLLASWPYTSAGRPSVSVLLGDAAYLVAATVSGQLAGRLIPWRLAAPVLGVLLYALLGLSPWKSPLLPSWGLWDEGDRAPWQTFVMALWLLALAATAVLVHTARRRYLSVLPPAALALVAAATLLGTGSPTRPDPLTTRVVCDTRIRPAVCVEAGHPGLLPEVASALRPLAAKLEGVGNLPARWSERGGRRGGETVSLPQLMYGQEIVRNKLVDPVRWRHDAAYSLIGSDPCDARVADVRAERVSEAVLDWLAPQRNTARELFEEQARAEGDEKELASYAADRAARERLRSMGTEERRAWLTRYFATRDSCDPKEVPDL